MTSVESGLSTSALFVFVDDVTAALDDVTVAVADVRTVSRDGMCDKRAKSFNSRIT